MADSTGVDYSAVLADLKAKRATLDAAIAGIEAMLGLRAASSTAETPADVNREQNGGGGSLGPGAFLGMSIVEASIKLLHHERRNMKTEEILSKLKDGGIVLKGESPMNVVGSVLNRNFRSGGDVVSVSRGVWGLAAWHPRLKRKGADSKTSTKDDENSDNSQTDQE